VVICGLNELPTAEREEVVDYVMDKDNWAKLTQRTAVKKVRVNPQK
jgi:hypothetical protein